jgi:choline dehydrogenase-like flavoprotein
MADQYDAVVVGAGATGGWAAKQLTEAGLRVLLLEAGSDIPLSEFASAPAMPGLASRQHIQRTLRRSYSATTRNLFVDDVSNPYTTPPERPFFWIRGQQVGGRSLMWNGMTIRFSDYEFKPSRFDGYGPDWPIKYSDIAGYYDLVETFLRVHGSYENLPQAPDGRFITPIPFTEGEECVKQLVESRWSDRRVVAARGVRRIQPLGSGDEWPSFTAQGSTLEAARRTGRLTVRANALASRIELDPRGHRARRVIAIDKMAGGSEFAVETKFVILCASTIETTRLLLNSEIGNGSVLGRFLMDHVNCYISGVAPALAGKPLQGGLAGSVGGFIPNFRHGDSRPRGFIRGYQVKIVVQRALGESRNFRMEECPFFFSACGEMLPREYNRVSVDARTQDAYGVPIPHIDCKMSANEERLAVDALEFMSEIADGGGFVVREEGPLNALGLMVHEVGTARMGADPETSVVNHLNQCWEVPNVFVTDGSCFVTSGWQNPTLTMMALTVRACDFIGRRLKPDDWLGA